MTRQNRPKNNTNKPFFPNRKKISEHDQTSGVYLLFDKDEIVYVGQGICAEQRVKTHIGSDKIFDSYHITYCKKEEMNRIEADYICKYTPKYNRRITCINTDVAPLGETTSYESRPLTLPAAVIDGNLYVNLSGTGISLRKRKEAKNKTRWIKIEETEEKIVWMDVTRSTEDHKYTKTEYRCLNPDW